MSIQKKTYIFVFLAILTAAAAVLTGAFALVFKLEAAAGRRSLQITEQAKIALQRHILTTELQEIASDLNFLTRLNETAAWADLPDQSHSGQNHSGQNHSDQSNTGQISPVQGLSREFKMLSQVKQKYAQIRLINCSGWEVVRVDLDNGVAVELAGHALQSKADRYYFKETIVLPRGNLYISPLDLNMEHGQIEVPYTPMLRIAAPVFDTTGTIKGILVLNYRAERLLAELEKANQESIGSVMMTNAQGYWLYHENKENEWGFMLKNRSRKRFPIRFPKAWPTISRSMTGQFQERGIFTYTTIFTFETINSPGAGSLSLAASERAGSSARGYSWKIISHVPDKILERDNRELLINLSSIAGLLLALAAVPSWFLTLFIVRRRQIAYQLYQSAHFDPLTALPNRASFMGSLEQTLSTAKRYRQRFAVCFMDLDGFKGVNDTLGHEAGDLLLVAVADRLKKNLRESDIVARLGGDEFTVILQGISTDQDALNAAEKLLTAVSTAYRICDQPVTIGASIGISRYPENGDTVEQLVKKADHAMYQIKERGKGDIGYFQE